jgi:hypothetical protein
MEIDHIMPQSLDGTDDEENLWLACPRCIGFKAAQIEAIDPLTHKLVRLFNPRQQVWREHLAWQDAGALIAGITPCGRASVAAFQLNFATSVELRKILVRAGLYPPAEEINL